MKIIRIQGGLGNQMFQFAFGEALRNKLGFDIKYDIDFFKNQEGYLAAGNSFRNFDLIGMFPLVKKKLSSGNNLLQVRLNNNLFNKISRRLSFCVIGSEVYKYILDEGTSYLPLDKTLQKNDNVYLNGYWQNLEYFENYFDLKYYLEFNPELVQNPETLAMQKRIESCNSVAIHFRGGDYLKSSLFSPLSQEYFIKAIKHCLSVVESPQFFIFSDDIAWAQEKVQALEIAQNIEMVFAATSLQHPNHTDLYLMSKCKHNIISNSTYSWWASYLNINNNKITIGPKQWTNIEALNNYIKTSLNKRLITI